MKVGLGEADELDDAGMVETTHNLHFFENIGALLSYTVNGRGDGDMGM